MIHKDLKSENCLLDATGTLKIADLGVSPVDRALLEEKKEQVVDVVARGLKDLYWATPEEARQEKNGEVIGWLVDWLVGWLRDHVLCGFII